MLPAGLLGDRLGRKKVLLVALVLFGASSAVCAYAGGTAALIAGRAVLGIGAAAIFPLSLSVIPVLFAPEERQKAIALMASATFISFPIGPVVGGYLLDHFWWGSVFLINVPIVAAGLLFQSLVKGPLASLWVVAASLIVGSGIMRPPTGSAPASAPLPYR